MPMNASVKYFSSDMPNAPKISGTKGSLIALLDACMVNGWNAVAADTLTVSGGMATATIAAGHGFRQWQVIEVSGATPGALNAEHRVTAVTINTVQFEVSGVAEGDASGTIVLKTAPLHWLKAFSGANKAAYQVDPTRHVESTGCLVRFDDNGNYGARVAGFETMTSIDAGSGQFPTDGQESNGLYVMRSESSVTTSYRQWFLIGDDRMFYLGINSYGEPSNYGVGPGWMAFGEFKSTRSADPFNFIVTGNYPGDSHPGPNLDAFCRSGRANYQYLPRSFDDFGGSTMFRSMSWPSEYGTSGGGPINYPNGPNNGLYLCPLDIFEQPNNSAYHHRGVYPGVLMLPHRMSKRVVPDRQASHFDTAVAGFENKVVGFFAAGNYSYDWGVVAFDLTGPWEH